ncbi:MAG: zinc-dependent metalloprotease, partial [Persicimonas sp.]
MRTLKNLTRAGLLGVAALFLFAGCAQDVGDIDRTQKNAIKKADLEDDEWYYQRTVVDVPAASPFTFVGNTDHQGMSRIKWDIEEDFLYARRETELIEGGDDKERSGEDYEGEVIAAYRIESHFDIQRQYNESTGEQRNVIVENTTDRHWNERDYMRVDWSVNLVTNYDLDFERQSIEPVPHYTQDMGDDDPDAPVFDYENPESEDDPGELEYFDITNKIHASADVLRIPGYGTLPLCWLRGYETTECGAGEYTIRNSFKRIDEDHEYVPRPYKGKETDVFGYFTTDRMTYDDKQGVRQQNKKRYLNRYNLWKEWYDDDGEILPAGERELRPIVYHVNRDFPDDLKEIANQVADDWNEIFSDSVEAQGYELEEDERVFILCDNNPVTEDDPDECGEPGDSPRLGDIRYSFMAYVPDYMEYGLLGLGPSNNDPETGEVISGNAYVYHWNDVGTYRTQEMIELLNGNRDTDDYIDGVDLDRWVEETRSGELGNKRLKDLNPDGEPFVENIATSYKGERQPLTEAEVKKQEEEGFNAVLEDRLDHHQDRSKLKERGQSPESKLSELEGTFIEDQLVDEELLMATGYDPNTEVQDKDMEAASVLRGGFAQQAGQRYKMLEEFAMERNMYLPQMADDALLGLARQLKDEEPEETYDIVRESVYTAVLSHEVGHALGLMHNFSGSEDAVNYHDEYWDIRDTDDDGEVAPRLEDPITEEEINDQIYNEAYSSIMDYAGRYTIDGQGVGKYDRAAILFGYAGKVEVFEDTGDLDNDILYEWFDQQGDVVQFFLSGPNAFHYTDLYNGMGEDLYSDDNRTLVDIDELAREDDGSVDWSETEDGRARVPYIYCSHNNADISDSCLTRDYGADSYERMKNMLDDLNTWYISRNFARGRIGYNYWNYVNNNYGPIYNRLKGWHDLYALYSDLLPTIYDDDQVEDFFSDPREGWGGKTWAVKNAFNYLVQTLMAPDVGGFNREETIDGYELYQGTDLEEGNLTLDVTEGRYYQTDWTRGLNSGERDCGYFWYECLHHVGFYLDKIMAIEALTDTQTNFVARATPED